MKFNLTLLQLAACCRSPGENLQKSRGPLDVKLWLILLRLSPQFVQHGAHLAPLLIPQLVQNRVDPGIFRDHLDTFRASFHAGVCMSDSGYAVCWHFYDF